MVKSTNFEATMLKSDSWLCHWLWMSYLAWPLYVADGIIIVPNYLIGLLQGLNEFEKVLLETLALKHYFWFWKKKKSLAQHLELHTCLQWHRTKHFLKLSSNPCRSRYFPCFKNLNSYNSPNNWRKYCYSNFIEKLRNLLDY